MTIDHGKVTKQGVLARLKRVIADRKRRFAPGDIEAAHLLRGRSALPELTTPAVQRQSGAKTQFKSRATTSERVRWSHMLIFSFLWLALTDAPLCAGQAFDDISKRATLTIGYTTFESRRKGPDGFMRSVFSYLKQVSHRSESAGADGSPFKCPIDFKIVLGNYYQIYEWLQTQQIDGAIVTPLTESLLNAAPVTDAGAEYVGLAEFSIYRSQESQGPPLGYQPILAASRGGTPYDNPHEVFRDFLLAALKDASSNYGDIHAALANVDVGEPSDYHLACVSHLSTSGFMAPVLFADLWLSECLTQDDLNGVDPYPGVNIGKIAEDPHFQAVAKLFWERFYQSIHFHITHGSPDEANQNELKELSFSWDLERKRLEDTAGNWRTYPVSRERDLLLPNDSLIIRRNRLGNVAHLDSAGWSEAMRWDAPQCTQGAYRSACDFRMQERKRFRDRLEEFRKADANELFWAPVQARLYDQRKFDFEIDELIKLIKLDQLNSRPDLALVLPGGGVRGLYQSIVLDELYGRRLLANSCDDLSGANRSDDGGNGPLLVDRVIGTSGGALIGLATALGSADGGTQPDLESLWMDKNQQPRIGAKDVFAVFFNLARMASFGVLMLILVSYHVTAFYLSLGRTTPPAKSSGLVADRAENLLGVTFKKGVHALLAVGILFALLMPVSFRIFHEQGTSYNPWLDGLLYFMVLLLVHFAWHCTELTTTLQPAGKVVRTLLRDKLFVFSVFVGAALLLVFSFVSDKHGMWWRRVHPFGASIASLAFEISMILAALAICSMLAKEQLLRRRIVRHYLRIATLIMSYLTLSYILLGLLNLIGWISLLEVTPEFWLALLVCGVVAAALLISVPSVWPDRFRGQLTEVMQNIYRYRRGRLFGVDRRVSTLSYFGTAALMWTICGASGIYGWSKPKSFLTESLVARGWDFGVPPHLETEYLCTGSALTGEVLKHSKPVQVEDIFFVFPGPSGKPHRQQLKDKRVVMIPEPSWDELINLTFASGTPFPIFPPQRVKLKKNEFDGVIVDGGYAHNVPIEAALMTNSRQVLVIENYPKLEKKPRRRRLLQGPFVENLPRILSFLFSQAQQRDELASRNLFVATIRPDPAHTDLPHLVDFRKKKILDVANAARSDLNRRVGFIDSWGEPVKYARVTSSGSTIEYVESTNGWPADVQARLEELLRDTGDGGIRRHAVFDFDNTCIKNDLGEAVFLKLVAELRYKGDLDKFWALIEDDAAATKLREYWHKYKTERAGKKVSLRDPASLDDEFREYLVTFYQQYEALVQKDTQAGYEWVVKLLMGLTVDEVRVLTKDTWQDGLKYRVAPTPITFGDSTVNVNPGIRVYREVYQLMKRFTEHPKWDVWVVTASNVYSVRWAASAIFGLPEKHVIGMTLSEDDGRLTSTLLPPSTYRPGKVAALSAKNVEPHFVMGDSMTDYEMLSAAKEVAIVVDRNKVHRNDQTAKWYFVDWRTLTQIATPSDY